MHAAAVAAAEITAIADDNRFEKLLVRARIIPGRENRRVWVGNIVNERAATVVTSLHRDYVPSSWTMFYPTMYDIGQYLFTFGIFFTAYFLFAKFFPVINMAEVKSIIRSTSEKTKA